MKYLVKINPQAETREENCPGSKQGADCEAYMFCPFPDGIKTIPSRVKKGKNK